MKNKIISIGIIFVFLFTSLISTNAIARTPRVDLDEYNITITNSDNVSVSGTCSICVGQNIGVYDSTGRVLYAYTKLGNSNSKESFTIQIPNRYIFEGKNTFKVKSLPLKNIINGSNPKTITVELKNITKKNQVITANNLNIKVNEQRNLDAKVNSNLPLIYKSNNINIATVDSKGNAVGRSKGTTQVVISQAGNSEYNPISKTVTITVKDDSISTKEYTITYNPNGGKGSMSKQKIKEGQKITLTKNKFTKEGYTFKGWNTTTNTKILYKDGQSISLNKNIILYAIWEKNQNTKAEKIIATCDKMCYVNKGKAGSKGPWSAKNKGTKPKDAAKRAFEHRGYNKKAQCADCGYFVSTVIYEVTGKKVTILGSNGKHAFPKGKKSIAKAGFYKISTNKNIPLDKLKPGDIIRYHKKGKSQHTLIYYGNGKVAEAGRSSSTRLIRWPVIQKCNKKWRKSSIHDFEVWRIREK